MANVGFEPRPSQSLAFQNLLIDQNILKIHKKRQQTSPKMLIVNNTPKMRSNTCNIQVFNVVSTVHAYRKIFGIRSKYQLQNINSPKYQETKIFTDH